MVIQFFPVRQQFGGALRSLAAPSSTSKRCNAKKVMRLHSIAMGVLCVLALSACGGGGGSTSPTTPSTSGASPSAVPTITAQPMSQSAVAGSAVTFTVSATGDALSYQWQDSANAGLTWTDIVGATSTGYTVSSISGAMNGRMYRAGISAGGTTVYSSAATLTVALATAPGISVQPADVSAIAGNGTDISVTASGTSLQYQWQVSSDGTTWQNIASATSALLHLASLATGDSGKHYRVIVSNAQGSITSNPVLLTVSAPPAQPSITMQPAAISVITGQGATFSVTASGNPAPSYQWQVSTDGGSTYSNIGGATASSYTLATTSAADNGKRFRVVVTNSQGSVTSSASMLTVATGIAPSVAADPIDTIANYPDNDFANRTATFTVRASGTPTPNLQWQVSTDGGSTFTNVNGATGGSYTTPVVSAADDGKQFRAVVTNAVGSVTSHPARLDVQNIGFGGLAKGMVVRPNGDIVATVDTCLGVSGGCASDFMGLRVLTHTGSVVSLAGNTAGMNGDVDGSGSAAAFAAPFGVTQDAAGNLYVSDWGNRIRKVTAAGVVTTLAGGDATGGFVNGTGTQASFYRPAALASDADGNVYVLDTKNAAIRKVTPTGAVTTLAGGASYGTGDGTGTLAQFTGNETGLAYDPAGKQLIVSNQYHCTIRKVSLSGIVTTISSVDKCSYADGPLAQATFASPNGVAVDPSGNIFVLDDFRIRKITPAGIVSTITTLPGGSSISWAIATDTAGNVYTLYETGATFPYTTSPVFSQSFLVRKVAPDGTVTTLP